MQIAGFFFKENKTKHINTQRWQNSEFRVLEDCGWCIYHCALCGHFNLLVPFCFRYSLPVILNKLFDCGRFWRFYGWRGSNIRVIQFRILKFYLKTAKFVTAIWTQKIPVTQIPLMCSVYYRLQRNSLERTQCSDAFPLDTIQAGN